MPPAIRMQSNNKIFGNTRFDEDPFLANFGIRLNSKMVTVDGRVLIHPVISSGENRTVNPREGVWKTGSSQFYNPSEADCSIYSRSHQISVIKKQIFSFQTLFVYWACLFFVFKRICRTIDGMLSTVRNETSAM
jgi:Argonaute linker 2 domain